MHAVKDPMGQTRDLASVGDLLPSRIAEVGFVPVKAFPLAYGEHGTAFVSEWVPDDAERRALASGARLRILTFSKGPVPLKVGVATGLKGDMVDMLDPSRLMAIKRRLVFADDLCEVDRVMLTREVIDAVVRELVK